MLKLQTWEVLTLKNPIETRSSKKILSSSNGKHCLQFKPLGGTAKSTRTTVSFANMSRAYIETQSLQAIQRKSYDIINVKKHFKQTEDSRHPLGVKIEL